MLTPAHPPSPTFSCFAALLCHWLYSFIHHSLVVWGCLHISLHTCSFHELLAVSTWSVHICKLIETHRVLCIHVANCGWQISLLSTCESSNGENNRLQSAKFNDTRNTGGKTSSLEAVSECHSRSIQQPLWNFKSLLLKKTIRNNNETWTA